MEKIVEAIETSRGEVREILGLLATMNKIVQPTYLSNDKESLIVAAYDIECGHGPRLGVNYILEQLQCVIKTVKRWCVDNYILKNVTPQLFRPSHQSCQ